MPRRMITPEIFRNEKFGSLTDAGRIFFIGCFTNADDDGRLKASPNYLKALIFPYDNDKSFDIVKEYRDKCYDLGLIRIYSHNGCEYLYCVGWEEHQLIRKDRYQPSKLPAPNDLFATSNGTQASPNGQPNDNHVATSGQPSDNNCSPQYSIVKYSINKGDKKSSPKTSDKDINVGELTKECFEHLDKLRGYRPPKRKAEAASIIRMLKTYSPDEIIKVYEYMKKQDFWKDKELFMMSVEKQIGAILNKEDDGKTKRPSKYGDGW